MQAYIQVTRKKMEEQRLLLWKVLQRSNQVCKYLVLCNQLRICYP